VPKELRVRLAGGYYFHTLKRLVRDLQPLFELSEPAVVVIDLADLTFMGPAALALTAAALHGVFGGNERLWEGGSHIVGPRAVGIHRYLHRMDFLRVALDSPDLVDPTEQERHEPHGFRECKRFERDEECREVAKSLADSARERVAIDDIASKSLYTCLTEIAENVYFHAHAPLGGYAAAQALGQSQELELAIVDLGVGIRESLSKNPDYRDKVGDDLAAIKLALAPTVTSTPGRNSGYGLTFTQLLLANNGGRLLVRSGYGVVQRGAKPVDKVVAEHLPGTLVGMRIRTDKPFDFVIAWQALSDAIKNLPNVLLTNSPDVQAS
jgi:anti-sigma regulatory factor (Ser/Thr protein kinase)